MFSSRFLTWTCPQLVHSWVLMYNTICWPVSHTWVFGVVYLKLNMRFPLEEFWNFQSESGMHLLVLFGLESRMYLLVLFQLESGKYVFVLLQRVAIGVRNVSLRLFSIKVWNWTLSVHVSLLTTTKCFLGDWYECWLRYLHILDHYLQVYMLLKFCMCGASISWLMFMTYVDWSSQVPFWNICRLQQIYTKYCTHANTYGVSV